MSAFHRKMQNATQFLRNIVTLGAAKEMWLKPAKLGKIFIQDNLN